MLLKTTVKEKIKIFRNYKWLQTAHDSLINSSFYKTSIKDNFHKLRKIFKTQKKILLDAPLKYFIFQFSLSIAARMTTILKYAGFAAIIIIFQIILIAVLMWNRANPQACDRKALNCDSDVCIRVCCGIDKVCLNEDKFDELVENEVFKQAKKKVKIMKNQMICDVVQEDFPWKFLQVNFLKNDFLNKIVKIILLTERNHSNFRWEVSGCRTQRLLHQTKQRDRPWSSFFPRWFWSSTNRIRFNL